MKKIFLLIGFSLIAVLSHAQSLVVTNAILFHKEGKLDKAKELIDKAAIHEKTGLQGKTWYYKGLIYMDLIRSDKPEYSSLVPNGLKESYEAFQRVQEYDKPGSEYYKMSIDKINE